MIVRKNEFLENFTYDTAYEIRKDYFKSKGNKIGVLAFLRYYGCTICQLDIMEFNKLYEKFEEMGADVKIVLQSTPKIVKEADEKIKLKFEIICDPKQELYEKFEIKGAESLEALKSGKIIEKVSEAKKLGLSHGEYEGNELQLPAVFIIDENNKVLYSHYAEDGADIPRAKEVLDIIYEYISKK
ncbi:redoxin domain-containing protein [Fusobacterium sp.]|uniref:redoxin domain-containing protein n=1 Tax=Fusobacterium sp. TaxID=68766 RepID=UPI002900C9F4|nr:redoxin domain-containing protein [Fusobacterium sp.]MDU1910841.1 redoxin domain-containing protein [Fusobacterium sp.]